MAVEIQYLLSLSCLLPFLIAELDAIKVDWNTNTGPIVPPTPTPAPVPKPPFRDPAPVWEDQSDDIPNPTPYRYILPPPSRPKYNDITTAKHNYEASTPAGKIISQPNINSIDAKSVPSLAVKYVPNKGLKYFAVVPSDKSAYLKSNEIYSRSDKLEKYDKYDKVNGRYNAKLKKYKAYEKVKFVPYFVYYNVPKQQYVYSSIPPKAVLANNL